MQCDLENIAKNQIRQLVVGALPASGPMTQQLRHYDVKTKSLRRRIDVIIASRARSAGLPGKV